MKVPIEVPCTLDTELKQHLVRFVICGSPRCVALNTRTDAKPEEFKNLNCYQCLDSQNMANLIFNVDTLMTWRQLMLKRCLPKHP